MTLHSELPDRDDLAREREAALREILQVISRSRDDEKPVFDVILRSASRLCEAAMAAVVLGHEGGGNQVLVAQHGVTEATGELYRSGGYPMDPKVSIAAQAIIERRTIHVEDMAETAAYREGDQRFHVLVHEQGIRTNLFVPLVSRGEGIGCLILQRREVRPYSQEQIALVETFAAQAVIAIENVRQFRELQSRLEREAATREILEVISRSREDDQPVFEVLLEKAAALCNAANAGLDLVNEARTHLVIAANLHPQPSFTPGVHSYPLDAKMASSQSVRECRIIHSENLAEQLMESGVDELTSESIRRLMADGVRTVLWVPLVRAGVAIGTFGLFRHEVRPFSDDEIALVETFAAQAVIAIENVRQFRELETRLEREAASREILGVISGSRDDQGPVFDLILENAARLCDAPMARLHLADAERTHFHLAAAWGDELRSIQPGDRYPLDGTLIVAQTILEARTIHVTDLAESPLYLDRNPIAVRLVEAEGIRTRVTVPLVSGNTALGCITLSRREVKPFTEDQIALVETFAAQAVIAIENVRQFRELQARLEREAVNRDILQVIRQNRDNEQPVFDAIVRSAVDLCEAQFCMLWRYDGALVHYCASHGFTQEFMAGYLANYPLAPPPNGIVHAVIQSGQTFHLPNAQAEPYVDCHVAQQHGYDYMLGVPIDTDDGIWGVMVLAWPVGQSPRDGQVELLETYAAQAVIAIENVRQFRAIQTANAELQTRLEREAATREILQVISTSRDDVQTVLETIVSSAARLCASPDVGLHIVNEARTHSRLVCVSEGDRGVFKIGQEFPLDGPYQTATAIRDGRVIHNPDIADDPLYRSGDPIRVRLVNVDGVRSRLSVPLMRDGVAFGCINLNRREVRPFTDAEITLIETFAAQAVIAIENVRQFRELQTRLEREAATREILQVIAQNRADEKPVFDAILENATRLCNAPLAYLSMANEARTHVTVPAHRGARPEFAADLDDLRVPMESSKLVLVRAITERKVIRMDDIADDELYRNREPNRVAMVEREGARSILAVPLISDGRGIGAIILYRHEVAPFSDDDVVLAESFAAQAAIAVDNVKQFRALEAKTGELRELNASLEGRVEEQVGEIERMGRLKRFLSPAVADAVVSSGNDKLLSSHRALIAVLFCDIRGFTAFCERAEPEETIEVLQTYHEEMGRLIRDHGGGVDTRAGDGIMVIFNDPLPCDDPAGDALRLALAMRAQMAGLCQRWRRLGHRLGFGVGISLGYATVGMVGSEGRYDYTASGTAVNLAARLCDEANDGEILLSPRAYAAVENDFPAESLGERSFKGIHAPVEVFRVTADRPAS